MEIYKKSNGDPKDARWQDDVNASIAELEELVVDVAEIEVNAGNLVMEDLTENMQDKLRAKMDADKKLEL